MYVVAHIIICYAATCERDLKFKDLAGIEPKTRFALVGAHQSGLRNRYTKPSFIFESRYTQSCSGMHSVIALLASEHSCTVVRNICAIYHTTQQYLRSYT